MLIIGETVCGIIGDFTIPSAQFLCSKTVISKVLILKKKKYWWNGRKRSKNLLFLRDTKGPFNNSLTLVLPKELRVTASNLNLTRSNLGKCILYSAIEILLWVLWRKRFTYWSNWPASVYFLKEIEKPKYGIQLLIVVGKRLPLGTS